MNPVKLLFRPWRVLFACGVMLAAHLASAQTMAFPGALGFGQYATGGRGGIVYHVTTLADSGTGSFRDAVSHSGRIIVFDVGGTITLASAVTCANNLTIAGQTAPGGGVAIIGHEVSFSVRNNEIVRFLRIRPGSMSSSGEDAINLGDGTNMIFDHVSLEFAGYNNIDAHGVNGSDAVTVQNSIIGDPMSNGTSAKQGFGAHTEHLGGKMSWYYNLWVSEHNRQPLAKIDTIFVNNTLYNFQAGYTVADTSGNFRHDIINNYFITGPTDPSGGNAFYQMNANQSIYSIGNLIDNNNDGVLNGTSIDPGGGGTVLAAPWSTASTNATVYSTAGAYYYDVSCAGALPYDQLDLLITSQIKTLGNGTTGTGAGTAGPGGGLYYDQTSTGLGNNGYGIVNGGIAAVDSDGDGMPDYWEKAVGLDPNNSSDGMVIAADGYANLEHYLNWLAAPHVVIGTNSPVDVDLWQYTGGFTNAGPVYVVNNPSNGVVTLNSGHLAHFVPTANFAGFGGFQFTVTANDGTKYTNTVSVLTTPITTPQNLTWVGDGSANVWTNGGPANWNNGTNLVAFASGDTVTFDDTGSNTPAINLSGAVSAGTVYVIADSQNYTFGGSGYLSGSTTLFKTGAGQLTLDTTNTYGGGTRINEGIVQIGDGLSYNGGLAGSVTNYDTLIFATPGTMTSSASISGSGTVTETGPGTLTLSGTQTYTGPTAVIAGALTLSGTLPPSDITNNGSLTLAPTSSQNYTNTITGPGSVTVAASGTFFLSGTNPFTGNLTNNSGFLILSNGAAPGLGTIVYNGGFIVPAANSFITNTLYIPGTAANDLNLMATNSGTATFAGNVVIAGSAQWRPGSDGGSLTFWGTAAMGTHIFIVPRGSMTFGSNAVVSTTTSGYLGRDGSGNKRSLNLTIRDNAAVSIGGCSFGGGKVGGSITITLQNSGSLSFGASTADLHNVANSSAISTVRLNGGILTAGGFTKTQSYTNYLDFNGGVLKAGASSAAFLPPFNPATSTNLVQAGGAIVDDGGFAITIGASLLHDPALGAPVDGGLTKLGTGSLTLTSALNSYTGPTSVKAGALVLSGSGALPNTTNIYVGAGALFDPSAVGSFSVGNGKMLWGNGNLKGNFVLASGATLAPGSNTLGTLTFSNSLALAAGSTSIFEVSHVLQANDSAVVLGALTNGGTLLITNVDATQLAAGDTFQLFTASSYTGTFVSVNLPALPFGLFWITNNLNTAGVISVGRNTTPFIATFAASGSGVGLSGTGGVGNASYVVLGSTNISLPVSSWTRLLTNQFDGSGNFNFTTNAGAALPQSYYQLQLQ